MSKLPEDKKFDQEKLDSLSKKYGLTKYEKTEPDSDFSSYALGLSLFSHIIIGMFLGYWIDKFFDCSPLGILLFLLFGFISGIRHIWKNIK